MDGSNVTHVTRALPPALLPGRYARPATTEEDAMTDHNPRRPSTGVWILVTVLLVIAVGGTLAVPIYARSTPALADFPFFYWYQLLWVPFVGILSGIAYLLVRSSGSEPASSAAGGPPAAAAPGTRPDDTGGAL
ncbi:MAG: hypothetical protein QOJ73_1894 [Streptosporangiaceae bacterium]|jgi:hypothetical protein|nr:hypothetical protein [Streptosporangiaceae bacterium]